MAKVAPDGYPTLCPFLVTPQASAVIDFMGAVFGARPRHAPLCADDGRMVHAEMVLGDSMVMLSAPENGETVINAMLHVYVEDCDAAWSSAMAAGAHPIDPPTHRSNGDRRGGFRDIAGNVWFIASRTGAIRP